MIQNAFNSSELNIAEILYQSIIKEVDYLICYVQGITGGSYKVLSTARILKNKGEFHITNLYNF